MKRALSFVATNPAGVRMLGVHQGEPNGFAAGAGKP